MAVAPAQIYPAPFDAIAERYDETFTTSKIGKAQRSSVWKELEKAFRPGDRVLEIGCGTGIDACFLAERGVSVVACDNSPRMIAVATHRIKESEKKRLVRLHLLAAENISSLRNGGSFDGAFSNFGALNCVEDLEQFANDLATLLKPGATALLCWMGPCCLWEITWYLARGKPGKAVRRFRRRGVTARLAEGSNCQSALPFGAITGADFRTSISPRVFQGSWRFGAAKLPRDLGKSVSTLVRFECTGRFTPGNLPRNSRFCRSYSVGIPTRPTKLRG